MIPGLFVLLSISAVVVAFVLRHKSSGDAFSGWRFLGCLAFNLFFVTYHLRFQDNGYLLLLGEYSALEGQYPVVGWVSLLAMLLHCFASPVKWRLAR
ncbi:hypothetical protein HFV04_023820 [Pseudomonas sp. BIGb0427]|uniref:hypothetical protein n=1 Tax=unclassified Pseudomonas TaxID=196821 RepID=UPI001160097F|nr:MULTISPECIES: hypothetical protein [unclassified Pseudomonas]QPG62521.1 hypothetical protein HFV04_023820 [Pseudomonas sp. BIGb0427]UVL54390.1 hypothetical protein LOY22_16075 [Pseudomonas sp. B21-035]UVM53942.1 hypothetical protein LOY37_16370 [Pseudomonas sp. B21-012]UVM64865.1 hypothetical protein LOY34_16105 [Pseudomonas sp. B21-009]